MAGSLSSAAIFNQSTSTWPFQHDYLKGVRLLTQGAGASEGVFREAVSRSCLIFRPRPGLAESLPS